jgi:hypothetical protein
MAVINEKLVNPSGAAILLIGAGVRDVCSFFPKEIPFVD